MVEELRGLAGQIADLARRNEALAMEVGTLRERAAGHAAQVAATEATIATKDQAFAADVLVVADPLRTAAQVEAEVARRREAALDATAAPGAAGRACGGCAAAASRGALWGGDRRGGATIRAG